MPVTSQIQPLDNLYCLETPEGSDLVLRPAGIVVRIYAFGIDFLIKTVVSIVASVVLSLAGGFGSGLGLILFFLLQWFYPVGFEVWRNGQTPGKKRCGIRVVNDDGTPVTFAASFIRNLLRVADFLPFFYMAGVVSAVVTRDFKRLGDLAAATLVVYVPEPLKAPELSTSGQIPVPADFTTDEQRALLAFAERAPVLSEERQAELAAILAPVLPAGNPAVTIRKMANAAVGRT